jgi:hypothetical protein
MPPGASEYVQVFLDRVRPREVTFTMNLGAPPDSTAGCGEFRGVARYKNGRWKLIGMNGQRPIRKHDNPACNFTKEQVLGCDEGGLTRR